MGQLARLNGMEDRLHVLGSCTPEGLQSALDNGGHSVIICDIEGGEKKLLDSHHVPRLSATDMLVEIHDFLDPTISASVRHDFCASHTIKSMRSRARTLQDMPTDPQWRRAGMLPLVSERRPGIMEWFWMKHRPRA